MIPEPLRQMAVFSWEIYLFYPYYKVYIVV